MITPVVPPSTPLGRLLPQPLVPAPVLRMADRDVLFAICVVGDSGRIADRTILAALGWESGTALDVSCRNDGSLLVEATPEAGVATVRDGYFRIGYRQRRRVHLFAGDRVLLLAHRAHRRVLILPPATLGGFLSDPLATLAEATS
ncbi:hypothetical protein [Nocardia sp. NPDC057353]|uniref:hypothetical protein n=1 Tax=Nocardia sp. NPDC057353 TaxID=3346104 RepID=UPI003634A2AC